MSTSGTYGYFPKIEHPNKIFSQMKSNALQTPFYFGGSQVPINLGLKTNEINDMHTPYKSHTKQMKNLSAKGRGLEVTIQKNHKIYLPKKLI